MYKNWFLGTYGDRTGSYFAGVDDISAIYPKFGTNLRMEVASRNYDRTGTYFDVIINQIPKGYFTRWPYEGIYNWNNDLTIFSNADAPIKKKLLIIGDSYITPMRGFTALCLESLYS